MKHKVHNTETGAPLQSVEVGYFCTDEGKPNRREIMAKKEPKPMRVWIELDPPENKEDGHKRAALLSAMLKKLGVDFGAHQAVWFSEKDYMYCFVRDTGGTFVFATDRGEWYNLEFLAK
jgi:hypothetical protein